MIIGIILFIIIGLFMLTGRGGFLIAGYNTLPAEQKAKYDEKRLCRFAGAVFIAAAMCLVLMEYTEVNEVLSIALFIFIIVTFVILVYTSDYFKK
ncbi:DUF3784 domain-containing protein [Macrococcoides canis]|uniref:DUF3784 domain-containing protein n=1 Tax=Macrococcoides canis TaxID=1855823 RepID=UPI0010FBD5CE|nr:DUF3784 domain-containing protein [Macrococcus canis]QCT74120.1 DUF3784 domain-containing protein [Macrococcus canis]QTQ08558.1 DUF3784 domain-containing protein [Macrococcus canis]QUR94177.1 DUF3784 domain-containing protein [Macrococcus canis]UTH00500.1 DUF3784 domain-containing protein [Macrococcus canis]UTH07309.1 DUF3784 domain-containing protein [Macrococcus canis]